MVESALAAVALATLVQAGLHALVGVALKDLKITDPARRAWEMYRLWWFALTSSLATIAAFQMLGAWGVRTIWPYIVLADVIAFLFCAATWGLVYYLAYIVRGAPHWFWRIGAFYLAVFIAILSVFHLDQPIAVDVKPLRVTFAYRAGLEVSWHFIPTLILTISPLVAAAVYLRLFFRIDDVTRKYRITAVIASIVLYFGALLFASLPSFIDSTAWQVAYRVSGVASALIAWAGFRPPHWVRLRWGIHSMNPHIDKKTGGTVRRRAQDNSGGRARGP